MLLKQRQERIRFNKRLALVAQVALENSYKVTFRASLMRELRSRFCRLINV